MLEVAVVQSTSGSMAKVRVKRSAMCASCGRCGVLSEGASRYITVDALNPVGARPGDVVRLEMESADILTAAFMAYILPLMSAGLGYFVGYVLGMQVSLVVAPVKAGLLGAVALLVASYGYLRLYDRRAAREGVRFRPVIKEVTRGPGHECDNAEG